MKYLPDEWIRSFPNPTHIDREHRGLRLASVTLTVTISAARPVWFARAGSRKLGRER
jgi:hypothetical protein